MSKRAGPAAPPTSAAPPLPAGPQPTPEQQAAINAAWTQYYAQQQHHTSQATPATPVSSQPGSANQYANYGYGAGVSMGAMSAGPTNPAYPIAGQAHPQAYPQPPYMVQPVAQPYSAPPVGYMAPPHHQPHGHMQHPPAPHSYHPGPPGAASQPVMGMSPAGQQLWVGGPSQQPHVQHGMRPAASLMGGGGGGGGGGRPPQRNSPQVAGIGAAGGLGIAQPMAQPQNSTFQSPGFRPPVGGGNQLPQLNNHRGNRNHRPGPPGNLPPGSLQAPPAKRPRMDGPLSMGFPSPTPSMRSAGPPIVGGSDSGRRGGPGSAYSGRDRDSHDDRREDGHYHERGGKDWDRDSNRSSGYDHRSESGYRGSGGGDRGGSFGGRGRGSRGGMLSNGSGPARDRGLPPPPPLSTPRGGSSRGSGILRGGRGGGLASSSSGRGGGHFGPLKGSGGRGSSIRGRGGPPSISTRGGRSGAPNRAAPGGGLAAQPLKPGSRNANKQEASANAQQSNPGSDAAHVSINPCEREKVAREEARKRTLTDFRIVGLEIKTLGWKWGNVWSPSDDMDDHSETEGEEREEGVGDKKRCRKKEKTNGKPDPAHVSGTDKEQTVSQASQDIVKAPRETQVVQSADPAHTEPNAHEPQGNDASESDARIKQEEEEEEELVQSTVITNPETEPVDSVDQDGVVDHDTKPGQLGRQEMASGEDDPKDSETEPGGPSSSSNKMTVEAKRGEKRKAKMSSPDADDDALVLSRKRATHGPIVRKGESVLAVSSEKNRFRIYFASPVEPADGPSLKELKMKTLKEEEEHDDDELSENQSAHDHDEQRDDDVEEEEHEYENEVDELEEFYEAEDVEGAIDQGLEEQDSSEYHEHESGVVEGDGGEKPDETVQDSIDGPQAHEAGDMSGVVEEPAGGNDTKQAESTSGTEPGVQQEAAHVKETRKDVTGLANDEPKEAAEPKEHATGDDGGNHDAAQDKAVEKTAHGLPETHDAAAAAAAATTSSSDVKDKAAPADKPNSLSDPSTVQTHEAQAPAVTKTHQVTSKPSRGEPASARQASTSSRWRRSPSLPATSCDTPRPEANRLSILYANGTRRICLNSAIVESVAINRKKGMIQVVLDTTAVRRKWEEEQQVDHIAKRMKETEVTDSRDHKDDDQCASDEPTVAAAAASVTGENEEHPESIETKRVTTPNEQWSLTKGILVESLDEVHHVFGPLNAEVLQQMWADHDRSKLEQGEAGSDSSMLDFPPFHRLIQAASVESQASSCFSKGKVELTAYLDMDKPLTEPKWVKSGQVEDWVRSSGRTGGGGGGGGGGRDPDEPDDASWRSKLKVVDPEAPPTLASVLDHWTTVSKVGTLKERRRFANGHLSSLNNMAQILLRAVRGADEHAAPSLSRSAIQTSHRPLRTAISPKDFYYTKQTFTTLAVMAIVNLVKEYSYEAKEARPVLEDKIGNVIKSLPNQVIYEATDSLFRDWTTQEPRRGS